MLMTVQSLKPAMANVILNGGELLMIKASRLFNKLNDELRVHMQTDCDILNVKMLPNGDKELEIYIDGILKNILVTA